MNSAEIRKKFLEYFKKQKHAIIDSSPTVPHEDPTLLFINAGMNQFKDVFLGKSVRDYARAATSQKCIRVGGKHNDLENVGHTKRHLTFFEMLGNFSFGDYFKEEAIRFAWDVSTEIFKFDPQRLWPTVYYDDTEAFEMWKRYVPEERITRLGEKDNFWAMGDTGPCGPCSEIFYDRGAAYGSGNTLLEDLEQVRFLEFWNLVFMQFTRDSSGELTLLPKASIDTGAGLERVMSLILDVDSVFDTDVLRAMIAQVEQISGKTYDPGDLHTSAAFRVIADHLRSLSFAIADGAQPSNVERGYVLRKVLRRAVRYGRSLGLERPFLAQVLPRLVDHMGEHYPELKKGEKRIAEILTGEEEAFIRTLNRGGSLLNQIIERGRDQGNCMSGQDAFKMKDTYGFPIEEILLLAKDAGLDVDMDTYSTLEEEARERSRAAQKTTQQIVVENVFVDYIKRHGACTFLGYQTASAPAKVTALLVDGQYVSEMKPGQTGMVILDKTSFYAEMGGQVGDTGTLKGEGTLFEVLDTQAPYSGVIAHTGKLLEGTLSTGLTVTASIDTIRRQKIANNHTATHLLHWALQKILGEHVRQAGSIVEAKRLRFDFSHHKALSEEEIKKIEDLVNEKIRENRHVEAYEIPYEEAQKNRKIKQFFGEKYGSKVRVIDLDYSQELCGGTHTSAVGNIGYFRIVEEGSIASGVRRIVAVTGSEAEAFARQAEEELKSLADLLKLQPAQVPERIKKLIEENKAMALQMKEFQKSAMREQISSLLEKIESIKGVSVLISKVEVPAKELRTFVEEVAGKFSRVSNILILASENEGQAQLVIRVSDDLVSQGIQANALIKELAPLIQGAGGGETQ